MSKVALQDPSVILTSRAASVACEDVVVVAQPSQPSQQQQQQQQQQQRSQSTTQKDDPTSITPSSESKQNNKTMPPPTTSILSTTTTTTSLDNNTLPLPIIVVGYPKSGTSSVFSMFVCGGFVSSHYCCSNSKDSMLENRTHFPCRLVEGEEETREADDTDIDEDEDDDDDDDDEYETPDGTCSSCIQRNKRKGLPMLEGCGDYAVFAQLDAERTVQVASSSGTKRSKKMAHLPQHFELERLHAYAPQATLVLNLRPPLDWAKSLHHWYGYADRFLETFAHNFTDTTYRKKNLALLDIYHNHTETVREFVRSHPSHTLLEVDITDAASGQALAQRFGIDPMCWGHHNKNWRNGGGSTNTTTATTTTTTTSTTMIEGTTE